jgi:hypothetical protein
MTVRVTSSTALRVEPYPLKAESGRIMVSLSAE